MHFMQNACIYRITSYWLDIVMQWCAWNNSLFEISLTKFIRLKSGPFENGKQFSIRQRGGARHRFFFFGILMKSLRTNVNIVQYVVKSVHYYHQMICVPCKMIEISLDACKMHFINVCPHTYPHHIHIRTLNIEHLMILIYRWRLAVALITFQMSFNNCGATTNKNKPHNFPGTKKNRKSKKKHELINNNNVKSGLSFDTFNQHYFRSFGSIYRM